MKKEKIVLALIAVSIIFIAVMLVWYMFGNSPTIEQVLVGFMLPICLLVFGIYERLNDKITATREHLLKELGEIKFVLGKVNGKLSKVNQK